MNLSSPVARRALNLDTYLFVAARNIGGKKVNAKKSLIDLSVGDPDVSVSQGLLKEAFEYALAQQNSHLYPLNRGRLTFRRAIAGWMDFRFGVRLDPETEVGVLSGSKEGLAHLAMTLYNPGEKILAGSLTYPVYKRAASLAEAHVEFLPMRPRDGYLVDFKAADKSNAKFLIINYPNNPTGAVADIKYFKELVAWARKKGVFLISDLAYSEIFDENKTPPPSLMQIPGAKEITCEFHSFSKSFGLAGLRLAWVCGNSEILKALYKLKDTYDSGTSNFSQGVGEFLLKNPIRDQELARIRQAYASRRRFFESGLKEAGLEFHASAATFYVWARSAKKNFLGTLIDIGNILAVNGAGFGRSGEGWLRFALCQNESVLKEAVARLKKLSSARF